MNVAVCRIAAAVVLLSALACGPVAAAVPSVTRLFPAGGARGETVSVKLTGELGSKPIRAWCSRTDVTVEVNDKGPTLTVKIEPDAPPGLCWFRLYNKEGVSPPRPFIVGTNLELLEKEPNNALKQAQRLDLATTAVNGVLDKTGDVDVFAVPARQGQVIVASMEANRRLGSPMDGILQIVSPRGFVLEQNDDSYGLDPQVTCLADADGVYFVRTFAFPAKPNSSVQLSGSADYVYRLTITTGAFISHTLPLSVTRGSQGRVSIAGWNLTDALREYEVDATLTDPFAVAYRPELANSAFIGIASHQTGIEQEPNDLDHAQPLKLPITVTGCIDRPRDADVYRFAAKQNEQLSFRVESRALGFPLDPLLKVIGPEGKVLTENDDQSRGKLDPVLRFKVPADGNFRVLVTDRYRHGGFRYVYQLTAEVVRPDYTLALAGNAFLLLTNKPLEIPITVTRQNGFAGEIEISISGLPDFVTAAPAVSSAKGATSKTVKLVLKTDPGRSFSGPIRITGRSSGDEPIEQVAQAPIKGFSAQTLNIWLTVRDAKSDASEPGASEKKP